MGTEPNRMEQYEDTFRQDNIDVLFTVINGIGAIFKSAKAYLQKDNKEVPMETKAMSQPFEYNEVEETPAELAAAAAAAWVVLAVAVAGETIIAGGRRAVKYLRRDATEQPRHK